jgi:hypothetical protein
MNDISNSIRGLLSIAGKSQGDLAEPLGLGSRQAMSNKMVNGRWSAADLAKVAGICGARLAFILPDGSRIYIDAGGKGET